MARMQIGELADRAGVSHRTIHYYERIGLIVPVERHGTGYRYYDETSVKRLKKIASLKRLGLSLDEIGEVIDLYFSDSNGLQGKTRVLEILEKHLAATNEKLSDLTTFKSDLEANIARMKALIAAARAKA